MCSCWFFNDRAVSAGVFVTVALRGMSSQREQPSRSRPAGTPCAFMAFAEDQCPLRVFRPRTTFKTYKSGHDYSSIYMVRRPQ